MSNTIIPIREPVTGREQLGDLSQPLQALVQFYKALNERDMALMEQNWDGSNEALDGLNIHSDMLAGTKNVHISRCYPFQGMVGHLIA